MERLVQDKYLAFCEESNAYASYTFDNAVKLLTLSIDKLKQQRIPSHLLDSSQRQQIEQSIISSEQRLAIYRVLSRFSNAKLYGIDNF
ncbi:MAG: hypothetical protein HWD59_06625 [Coxiellaceae bacterium]|nr:MAG: hypothetical protein HWD59_06625 [Coxiellaceae bacterium]